DSGTLAIEGPAAAQVLREATGVDLNSMEPRAHVEASVNSDSHGATIPCRVIRQSLSGLPGAEFLTRRDALVPLWERLKAIVAAHGGAPIGYEAINSLRLEAGVRWFGVDFDERHIPHEAGIETSHISYIKGCYTGQEIVERVRSRGQVNRRLTALQFKGERVPESGSAVRSGDHEAGAVTSAAFSPLLGSPIGWAYLQREDRQPGTALECNGEPAQLIELPLPGAAQKQPS